MFLRRFVNNITKYREFVINSVITDIAVQYANSLLGYLWWILDPLMYMFIYIFMVSIVLQRGGPDYPIYLFSGLLFWRWFQRTLINCTNSISSSVSILSQVYIPKYLLPLIKVGSNSFFFVISIFILFGLLFIYKIPITIHIFGFFPLFLSQIILISGIGIWLSHFGVYYSDIDKLFSFAFRIWYYLSPGLYRLESVPEPYRKFMWLNPLTTTFESSRNIFLNGEPPLYLGILIWSVIGLILLISGIKMLDKYDRYYTKVISS